MKKIYIITLLLVAAMVTQAQQPVVTFDYSTACVGAEITATIEIPEYSIPSTAVRDNQQNGVMFDIVGEEGAVIKGFLLEVDQNDTEIEIYYRTGSYAGFENSNAGWTLLGTGTGIASGVGVNAGVELDLPILPGQTLGFYITTTNAGTDFIGYASGTAVGTELASNLFLTINSGVGKSYPFGTTYTPRNFVGTVLYEPVPTDIVWSDNASTGITATYTASTSMGVVARMVYGGSNFMGSGILHVNEYDVTATATPAVLGWDESSTLSSSVTQVTGLGTTFQAGNRQNGAMFDITASTALQITGFDVFPEGFPVTANVEVLYKTGTFVGSEANSGVWTTIGSAAALETDKPVHVALTSPLAMAPGQTMGIYVRRSDGYVYYSNATAVGDVFASDANLTIKVGKGVEGSFGSTYNNRMMNTIVHYEVENPAGLNYTWAPEGGTAGSAVVTPNADVTYTVTVTDGGCEGMADVAVSMAMGVEDALAESITVYPNPATDNLIIKAEQPLQVQYIMLLDMSGKAVYEYVPTGSFSTTTIPVNQLAEGMYLLQMNVNGVITNHKVVVR
ncbi:MAG: T9SS type A sorting domain-containing protein [Flavobacteriales bacterium]|nr:T9SS type A sorting domain-containing protein [Flavobacteriales bacterium]MCB9203867.1 T9SS type A sorting domain-containing protein [Flavobacteriales bacterium]